MNDLPFDLLEEILFKLEPKSLARMRCTNKFFQLYVSDQKFEQCFFIGSPRLLNLSSFAANYIYCQPLVSSCGSISPGNELHVYKRCYILGSCSGLLLIYISGLFIANPLTMRFRLLDHSGSKLLPIIVGGNRIDLKDLVTRTERAMCVGFAVNRYRTILKFKIVCILEMETWYGFEINDGNCWKLSKTTITTNSKSDIMLRMKPVYLNGNLYWLRNDGSIIAFNPETEQARLIPSRFHKKPDMKLLFAADDKANRLTLISRTKETLSVYTLLGNIKWTLAMRIKNVYMNESELECWSVVAYDGKRLVLWENKDSIIMQSVLHVYDMETQSWGVLGSTTSNFNKVRDFYKFTPFLFSIEEDEQTKMHPYDRRISYLTAIMGLVHPTNSTKLEL